MSMTSKESERKFLLECIELYKELPCLWKIRSEDYMNRHKKNIAYDKLVTKFRERYEDATREDVKKKINSLRTNFRKELKKIRESSKFGMGSDEPYESTLWYYDAMKFLEDSESLGGLGSITLGYQPNDEVNDQSGDDYLTPIQTLVSSPTISHSNTSLENSKKRKRGFDATDELIALACQRLRKDDEESENLCLAKSWAFEISKMDEEQQILAKKSNK